MKVGLLHFRYPLYSKGSYIQEATDALAAQQGVDVVYVMASRYPAGDFPARDNVRFVWLPYIGVPILGSLILNFAIVLWGLCSPFRQVDILSASSARPIIGAKILSLLLRKPLVITIEIINAGTASLADWGSQRFQRWVYTRSYAGIICWSHYYWEHYLKNWGVDAKKVWFIPCGIDMRPYALPGAGVTIRRRFPASATLIVFAKPMYDYNFKMASLLLRSIARLGDAIDVRLMFGNGERRDELLALSVELGLSGVTEIIPWVPFDEIPQYLAASDLVVLPFTYPPTSSRSLLESLAAGKPVITTRMGEVERILTDGEHAMIVDVDEAAIAEAIVRLVKDAKLRDHLGRHAQKLISTKFSSDTIAAQTVEVFRSVLGNDS